MRKAVVAIVTILMFCLVRGSPAFAEVVLDDHFNDYSMVDLARTTAHVNTIDHYVSLPSRSLSGAIEMLHEGLGYVVASTEGVNLYEFDDATGTIIQNSLFSCPWATDATGVSVKQDELNMWAVTESSVAYYKFNGAGMSDDPALKVSGLNDVMSVAALQNSDSALVLQKDGSNAKITLYEASGVLNPVRVFSSGIADPVKVTMVGNTPDFRLFTGTAAYYFMYDDFTGDYIEDPLRKITGLANVVSGAVDEIGTGVLTENDFDYYINVDSNDVARIEALSVGAVASPVAISLKPGTYEQVFIDENGKVEWWTYDDSGDRMIRDTSLGLSGLTLNTGFATNKDYFSKVLSTASYDAAKLTVTETILPGTSINYEISSNGGATFVPIAKDTWTKVAKGNNFVVRATLQTTDTNITPKIHRVVLELEDDFVLLGSIVPQPASRGQEVVITANGTSLTSGGVIGMDSCIVKYPLETKTNGDPALPDGQFPLVASMAYDAGINRWKYNFIVPNKTVDKRWPDNGIYKVEITGVAGSTTKKITMNLEISGNILDRLIIKTSNW